MSTHRWEVLTAATGTTLKRSQDTRWSARGDAVNVAWQHYETILVSLENLTNTDESINTRTDAASLMVAMESFSFLCFLGLWQPILREVNDAQNYLQTKGLNVIECANKINALQMGLQENREKYADNALEYAKNLCEKLGISLRPPRRTCKKHIFGDGTRDAALFHEDELKRQMLSVMDKVLVETRDRFEQLKNLAERFSFLMPSKLLHFDDTDFNTDEIDKEEFNLERLRLRTFVVASGNKDSLINSDSLELLRFIVSSKLEISLPNIVIMLRLFLTIAISNASCERSFSKLKLIKNYLRSTMSTTRLTNLAIISIERDITEHIEVEDLIKNFAGQKSRRVPTQI